MGHKSNVLFCYLDLNFGVFSIIRYYTATQYHDIELHSKLIKCKLKIKLMYMKKSYNSNREGSPEGTTSLWWEVKE